MAISRTVLEKVLEKARSGEQVYKDLYLVGMKKYTGTSAEREAAEREYESRLDALTTEEIEDYIYHFLYTLKRSSAPLLYKLQSSNAPLFPTEAQGPKKLGPLLRQHLIEKIFPMYHSRASFKDDIRDAIAQCLPKNREKQGKIIWGENVLDHLEHEEDRTYLSQALKPNSIENLNLLLIMLNKGISRCRDKLTKCNTERDYTRYERLMIKYQTSIATVQNQLADLPANQSMGNSSQQSVPNAMLQTQQRPFADNDSGANTDLNRPGTSREFMQMYAQEGGCQESGDSARSSNRFTETPAFSSGQTAEQQSYTHTDGQILDLVWRSLQPRSSSGTELFWDADYNGVGGPSL